MDASGTKVPTRTPHHDGVLIVITTAGRRGAELEGVELARELRDAGRPAEVVALTTGRGDLHDVVALGPSPLSLRTLRALRARATAASIVVAYGSSTLPACALALAGTRTSFVYRSIGDPVQWLRGRTHRWRTRVLFRRAEHVVALWPGAAEDIRRAHGLDADGVSVIPNARGSAAFRSPSAAQRSMARVALGLDDERPVVLTLGSLSSEKRVDRAIAVADELPDVQLVIAGDGPDRAAIESLARGSRHSNVRMLGAVSEPTSVLHAADVLLLTSDTEGMPGVIIEAGLCGVPSVAPQIGGIPALVVDGVTGRTIDSDAPTDYAAGVRDVLQSRQRFGVSAESKLRAENTWEVVTPRWIGLLDSIRPR